MDQLIRVNKPYIADRINIIIDSANAILRGFMENAITLSIAKLSKIQKSYLDWPENLLGAVKFIVSVSSEASIRYKIPLNNLEFSLNLFKIST